MSLTDIAEATSRYFDGYLDAIDIGEGRADAVALEDARSILAGASSGVQYGELSFYIESALDVLIGFDFTRVPGPDACSARRSRTRVRGVGPVAAGNIRGTPPESALLVRAARSGILEAILNRNLNALEPPIRNFWQLHPDYHPFHTGRAYPHGHDEYGDDPEAPLRRQLSALKIGLRRLLNDGRPLCGDGKREGAEICDFADASACGSFGCRADCTCDGIED